ncbi:MAG: ATP-dependent RNA helicase HrpA, partial [Gammaproteobacteria bacterium]|nr:ATP-dependent RNA helicase HrpA [Gammaproteobacteria bacterium]
RINNTGRALSRFPIDPRLARTILTAKQYHCLREVLIITSALSIQDPRERPMDRQQQADEARKKFQHEQSDFLSLVKLWDFYTEQRQHLSQSKLRKLCKQNFLSYVRMEEWRDILQQLHNSCSEMKFVENTEAATPDNIHQALLSGFLSYIGLKDENHEYMGARNSRFMIFPGSGVQKKQPKWIMAASMMETSRLFAHTVAAIKPEWIEQHAQHLIKRSYSEAHWQKKVAQVAAYEKTTLYGLVINPKRRVNYGPLNPAESREIFIREALANQQYATNAPFYKHNSQLIHEVEELEHKSRRQDILVDEQLLYEFYAERIPEGIYSGKHFETWRKEAEKDNARILFLDKDYLMQHGAEHVTDEQFPKTISVNGIQLKLDYHFEPGHFADGVTVTVPVSVLNQLSPEQFDWLVPGLLKDKVTQLIKSLPKQLRRNFVPAPDFASKCLNSIKYEGQSLVVALSQELKRITSIEVPLSSWQPDTLPAHFFMNFKIVNAKGKQIGMDRDLGLLQQEFSDQASEQFSAAANWEIECEGLTEWSFADLPEYLEIEQHGIKIKGFPALVDKSDSVAIKVFDNVRKAKQQHHLGLRRLFMLQLQQEVKYLQNKLPGIQQLCMHYAPIGKCDDLKKDIVHASIERVFLSNNSIRDKQTFEQLLEVGKPKLVTTATEICDQLSESLQGFNTIRKKIKGRIPPAWLDACHDIQMQLEQLIQPGFVSQTPELWLSRLPVYLRAIEVRLNKLELDPNRDRKQAVTLAPLWDQLLENIEQIGTNETL